MSVNNATFLVDNTNPSNPNGLGYDTVKTFLFTLKGNILPVLYQLNSGVKDYIDWDHPSILSLKQMTSDTFQMEFVGIFVGYLQLLAYEDDIMSADSRFKFINSTLETQSKAISDRVPMNSWKEMNNYLQSEIIKLQNELATTNTAVANLAAQVQLLMDDAE